MRAGFQARDRCPVCDTRERRELCAIRFDDPRMADFLDEFYRGRLPLEALHGGVYRVVACRRCQFVFQDPVLDDSGMHLLYEQWIDDDRSLRKKQSAEQSLMRRYTGQLRSVAALLHGAPATQRLLEFGMGWGYWCRAAHQYGFDVSGFELSAARRAYARTMGAKVIDELPAPGARFDCIYSSQVFEHLPEPRQTLRALCARLVPGGLVYLRVPDGRGVAQTLATRGWSPSLQAIHPLEHINCFTRGTLTRLAVSEGLRRVDPPPRLAWRSPWRSLKREIFDRYLNTHLFFRYDG